MTHLSRYRDVLEGRGRTASELITLLPAGTPRPHPVALVHALERMAGLAVRALEPREGGFDVRVRLQEERAERDFQVRVHPTPPLEALHVETCALKPPEREAAHRSSFSISLSTRFTSCALHDFHRQLQVLAALAPRSVGVLDVNACLVRPARWLHDAAGAFAPPAPSDLYALHVVGKGPCWLHSHGLSRCGILEVEALEVPHASLANAAHLLHTAVALFLDAGLPAPGHTFRVGRDLALQWLPWEEALQRAPHPALGGAHEREGSHATPRAVLLVPRRRWVGRARLEHLGALDASMGANPLLFRPALESERAALLARERLPLFRQLFARHAGQPGWRFLVKLGYPAREGTREHLWFSVEALEAARVEATCLNAPYAVPGLGMGQRAWHELALLSDVCVVSPQGRFEASALGALLEEPAPALPPAAAATAAGARARRGLSGPLQ